MTGDSGRCINNERSSNSCFVKKCVCVTVSNARSYVGIVFTVAFPRCVEEGNFETIASGIKDLTIETQSCSHTRIYHVQSRIWDVQYFSTGVVPWRPTVPAHCSWKMVLCAFPSS